LVKSVEQGISLPSKEANASALRVTRFTLDMLEHQTSMVDEEVLLEAEIIKKEASLIVDKVLEMGDGDVAQGVYHAFESGMLEGPFSSNKHYSKGKIMVIRDAFGACRYYDFGDLPFTPDIKEYHRDRIRQREELEGKKADFDMITNSILGISKGKLVTQSINDV
jgi:methylaspartate mutase epsilon subunit